MTSGPRLTAKMKRALQAEIKAFDKAKTLRELEANSISKPDVNTYQEHIDKEGFESLEANPNQLSEEQAFKWGRSSNLTADEEIKRAEIQRLLSPKQWAIWMLCMQQALTQQEAARQLGISQPTLSVHLKRSIEIVTEHFSRSC